VASPISSAELLTRAGFVEIEELDCTSEFATTARAWIEQSDRHYDALCELVGADEVDQRQTERRLLLRAVEDGLLRRALLVATRPIPIPENTGD
jgi:hypothetical protein